MKACPFCGKIPTVAHAFVYCANPSCRLSRGGRMGIDREYCPVIFTIAEWDLREEKKYRDKRRRMR